MNSHSSPLRREEEISLDGDLREALSPWMDLEFLESSVPIQQPSPQLRLMTDASGDGWGGVLQLPSGVCLEESGVWPEELLVHSMNWLELKAILCSIQAFLPHLRGKCIGLLSDNRTALSCLKRLGSLASLSLWSLSRDIFLLCRSQKISLSPSHLKGVLNVLADKASRRTPIVTEWSLDDQSFQALCLEWGSPEVDIMATWENRKLSSYVSPCPDFQALEWDIFSCVDWNNWGSIYVFSPVDRGSSGESNTEITLIPGEGFPDSSPVALQGLVPFPSREVSCQAPPPGGFFSDPTSFGGRGHLPRGFRLKPLRLEVMREALLQEGFSHRAIEVILGCHKISTIKQYQSAWSRFLNFLEKKKIRHDRIRLCHVLNFLSFEQEVNERAYSTIAAYKCALFLPLKIALNLDLAGERVEKMMNGFYNLAPPEKRPMPSWDLSAFLFYLQSDRFEPIESIPFQDLALKLLALLALGTGRRIGELAELSRSTYEKSGRVFIKWLPGYRAKWDSAHSRFIPRHPSIQAMKSRSALSLRLCPLRVLSCYLERRKDVVRQDKDDCLWLRKIDGLSRDLRGLIKASRRWSNEPAEVICFHQLKKLAVSYCFKYFSKAEMSLPGIVGNSSWKTLKDNYLGDVPPLRCTCVLPLGTVDPAKLRGRRRQ